MIRNPACLQTFRTRSIRRTGGRSLATAWGFETDSAPSYGAKPNYHKLRRSCDSAPLLDPSHLIESPTQGPAPLRYSLAGGCAVPLRPRRQRYNLPARCGARAFRTAICSASDGASASRPVVVMAVTQQESGQLPAREAGPRDLPGGPEYDHVSRSSKVG
jgi:hypothetical protein